MINHRTRRITRRRAVHAILIGVAVSLLSLPGVLAAPAARGAPNDVTNLPGSLQKYVPGSAEWAASPWMISPPCKDKGGDFSVWAENVVVDIPRFASVFLADMLSPVAAEQDRLRGLEIAKGFGHLSGEFRDQVPADFCVEDVKRWAGANAEYKPFGFAWGVTHRTPYLCVEDRTADTSSDTDNRWVGAERAACDGFFIACDNASGEEHARCEAWNAFSVRFTQRGKELREAAISRYPARGVATYHTEVAWQWVMLVGASGAVALAGLGLLIVRRRRGHAPASVGGNDVAT